MKRRIFSAVLAAAAVLTISAGAVMAGEVTGNGNKTDQNQGMSWCSFSGQNDRTVGEGPTDTRSQSFGQDVKASVAAGNGPLGGVPGTMCNPQKTVLGPNPNRTP
jgi:hypothetical protein